ncbi:hypothetical protein Rhow_007984 [Rhodococcus wratislaviensis]|uniref:Uncharacterized protein n=1 Tax=Rhodococcus wratislaviensis TaxID=44752 RepID=A0A402C1C7_RHOWR|nr:hypothetical protein Rhow_007984 [Rhodococcus wratislaviensis]
MIDSIHVVLVVMAFSSDIVRKIRSDAARELFGDRPRGKSV